MKKKIIALLLVLAFMLCLVPSVYAQNVCFISANDTLLELTYMPYIYKNVFYVPGGVFAEFDMYYTYFQSQSTASLYSAETQLYFEMDTGRTYDGANITYNFSAIMRNGVVYLPLGFICDQFGLSYNYITGGGYGNIIRIKNGQEILSDSQFTDAARSLMRSRYTAYIGSQQTTPDYPGIEPTPSLPEGTGKQVYLCFEGMPSDALLKMLGDYDVYAGFFMTPEEIRQDPDRVRKLTCLGHSAGVLCSQNAEQDFELGAELVFQAAMTKTLLVAAVAGCEEQVRDMAEERSLVYRQADVDAMALSTDEISQALSGAEKKSVVRIVCGQWDREILTLLVKYLISNDYELRPMREV